MSCKMCNDSMMSFFDGTLNDIETAKLRQHLKVCSSCNKEFESYKEIISFLEEDLEIEPPLNFEASVMEKINALEVTRKRRTDSLLIFIYGVSTVILVCLAMVFLAGMKDISLLGLMKNVGESFSSLSNAAATMHSIFRVTGSLITGLLRAFFQTALIIMKTYYYIFIALLALYLVIQRMFIGLVRQDSGRTK